MRGLEEYNLRDLQKEISKRIGLEELTTEQLVSEINRREEEERRKDCAIMPIEREFLNFCGAHFDTDPRHLTGENKAQDLSNIRSDCLFVAAKALRLGPHRAALLFGRKHRSSFYDARKVLRERPELTEEAHVLETNWKNRRNK